MKLLTFFIPLILYFLMGSANAYDCTFNTSEAVINADPVVISPTANTASMIGPVISSSEINYLSGCSSTVGMYTSKFEFSAVSQEDKTLYDNRWVYKMVDHKGIGLAIGASMSSCAGISSEGLEQWAGKGSGTHYFTLCSSPSGLANPTYKPKVLIQFYKMDGLAASTSKVRSLLVGQIYANINSSVDRLNSKYVYLNVDVIQGSCAISTPNVTVNMGTIYRHVFSNIGNLLAAGPSIPFSIGIACGNSAVPVSMKIEGNNGFYEAASMGIINPDTSVVNSATGIGIQIQRNGKDFPIGQDKSLGSLSGDKVIEFTARYAKLPVEDANGNTEDNPVTVGKFKATATVTLTYK